MKLLLCFALFAFSSVVGESCTNPRVKAVAYTNSDAQVLTQIAFVAEFELECANGVTGVSLHADVEGAIVPAIRVKDDANNKYQVRTIVKQRPHVQRQSGLRVPNVGVELGQVDGTVGDLHLNECT